MYFLVSHKQLLCFHRPLPLVPSDFRGSRPDAFCKKGVLKSFAKFTGKYLRQSLFFNKVAGEHLF